MKIKFEELQKIRPFALETRVMAHGEYNSAKGTKPRAEEETLVLAILTINRVNKAIQEGRWVFKGARRIEFRSN